MKNVNMKGVVSRMVVRALEIMAQRRRQKAELEVAQMKMWGRWRRTILYSDLLKGRAKKGREGKRRSECPER